MEFTACRDHPGVEAVAGCCACGRQVCDVCVFVLASRPYCPDCATAGPSAEERSKVFNGGLLSVVLAVVGFVITAGLFVGGAAGMRQDAPILPVLSFVWLGCGLGGLATGLVARDGARRTGSVLPLVGTVASGLLVALQVVAIVFGGTR